MQTLSHGFLKPESGDTGSEFFPALEENMQQLNDHTHDGTNSAKLSATSSEAVLQTPTVSWVDTGDGSGTYSTLVSLPSLLTTAGLTFDTVIISVRTLAGALLFLRTEKVGPGSFNVFSNDNTLALSVVYST